ncbi:MAG TPA: S1/P1 nuclease [Pyrinomonadaceae bacterium]
MRRIAATFFTLVVFVSASTPAFGWGDKGHKVIGQIAQLRLANTNTLKRVRNILKHDESLSSVATWADRVKDEDRFGPTAVNSDPDTQDFFRRLANQHNRNWHFANLPLHCASYNDVACKSFTSSRDIVHLINLSIRKLQGGNVPQLTQRNALRLLVHLVGDLHQPLHVGVGFINVDDEHNQILIEREPNRVRQNDFPSDFGGNNLLITGAESDNLHSFWDTDLVEEASGNQSVLQFAALLNGLIPTAPNWDAQGNVNTWAAQWASDSVQVSNEHAYDSTIRLKKVVIIDDRPKYRMTRGNNYTTQNIPIVKLQLEKGGYRLAKLLQAILP